MTPDELTAYLRESGNAARIASIDMAALGLRRKAGNVRVLDVRGKVDYDASHIPGALNIAHPRLLVRLAEIPRDQPVLVHCASGARAAHAVALLERHGYDVVHVGDLYANWHATSEAPA